MSYTVEIEEHSEYLNCEFRLEFTPDSVKLALREILHKCITSDQYNVLLDFTSVKQPIPAIIKLFTALNVEEVIIEHKIELINHPRLSILARPPALASYRPGEEHFKSIGWPLAAFTDKDEALEWLLSDRPTP